MSRVTELEKALTTLFCKGTEVGYTETEIDEFLENIDYPPYAGVSDKPDGTSAAGCAGAWQAARHEHRHEKLHS